MASIINTIMLVSGPLAGVWLNSYLTRSKDERQWRRDRGLEVYTDILQASDTVMLEANRAYLEVPESTQEQLEVLSQKTAEFHHVVHRAALLASNEMTALNALVVHVDKMAARAGAFPKLSLDEWGKITTIDMAVIVAKYRTEARNDLRLQSTTSIVDWLKRGCAKILHETQTLEIRRLFPCRIHENGRRSAAWAAPATRPYRATPFPQLSGHRRRSGLWRRAAPVEAM